MTDEGTTPSRPSPLATARAYRHAARLLLCLITDDLPGKVVLADDIAAEPLGWEGVAGALAGLVTCEFAPQITSDQGIGWLRAYVQAVAGVEADEEVAA